MKTGVVLLAAGSGRRFGGGIPKQFLPLDGEPVYLKSFRVFAGMASVREIVIVAHRRHLKGILKQCRRPGFRLKLSAVEGGRFRGESVRSGVLALSDDIDVVLVHDAARPLVAREVVRRVERAAFRTGAALAAWPLGDTLKVSSGNHDVQETIPRKNLWVAQTPQGFRRSVAVKCLLRPSRTATDDVELAERKGFKVKIVAGNAENFKITFPLDLKIARGLV